MGETYGLLLIICCPHQLGRKQSSLQGSEEVWPLSANGIHMDVFVGLFLCLWISAVAQEV